MHLPPDLFITNKPPNDEELFKAREVLNEAKARLEIVQKIIPKPEEEQHTLLKKIKAYELVTSPLRRVPDDIIGEILLACTDSLPKVDINAAPLTFMRISRRIRQIALNLPRLWADITIESHRASEKVPFDPVVASRRRKSYMALVSQWLLVRSGAVPLNILIQGIIDDEDTATNVYEQGLPAILFQCKPRWQDVTVTIMDVQPLVAQFIAQVNDSETDYRHLRRLDLSVYFYYTRSRGVHNFSGDGLLLAPNLTDLKLCTTQPITLNPALLKWTKLTSLFISGSVNVLAPVIRQAPSLINLTINCVSDITPTETYNAGTIRIPYLTNFSIMNEEGGYGSLQTIHAFLDILDPPLLKTLTLEGYEYFINEESLSSLLSRIRCLEFLTADTIHLEAMPRILSQTPMLKELHITNCDTLYTSDAQTAFLDAFENGHVCPHLQVLDYYISPYPERQNADRLIRLRKDIHRRPRQR